MLKSSRRVIDSRRFGKKHTALKINFRLSSKIYWLFDIERFHPFCSEVEPQGDRFPTFRKNTAFKINFLLSYKIYWLFDIRRFHIFYAEVEPRGD
jgi:hypothetical protein